MRYKYIRASLLRARGAVPTGTSVRLELIVCGNLYYILGIINSNRSLYRSVYTLPVMESYSSYNHTNSSQVRVRRCESEPREQQRCCARLIGLQLRAGSLGMPCGALDLTNDNASVHDRDCLYKSSHEPCLLLCSQPLIALCL